MNKSNQEISNLQETKRELQGTIKELKAQLENARRAHDREQKDMQAKNEQVERIPHYAQRTNNTAQKATIHQVTTMIATSKNVLFPGHNHLLTTDTDDPTL